AEFDAYSIHIDSLALISATASGLRQHILPPRACTYHVSHEDGWEMADPIRKLYKDIERPMLDSSSVRRLAFHLFRKGKPLEVNEANWGFADQELPTFTLEPSAR
ncbi:MAG: hypothetical protein KDC54_17630, partial [Lewinella sp.]|nr:hypothetical protein [Lewinella sp.]